MNPAIIYIIKHNSRKIGNLGQLVTLAMERKPLKNKLGIA